MRGKRVFDHAANFRKYDTYLGYKPVADTWLARVEPAI
jgi:hypothetical protein